MTPAVNADALGRYVLVQGLVAIPQPAGGARPPSNQPMPYRGRRPLPMLAVGRSAYRDFAPLTACGTTQVPLCRRSRRGRLIQPIQEIVQHQLLGPLRGPQHAIDPHVDVAAGQIFERLRQDALVGQFSQPRCVPLSVAQETGAGISLKSIVSSYGPICSEPVPNSWQPRSRKLLGQRRQPWPQEALVIARAIQERFEAGPLSAEFLPRLLLEIGADAKLPGEVVSCQPHHAGLSRQVEAQIVQQLIDSPQRQPPTGVEPFVARATADDRQRGFTVGVKQLFGQRNAFTAAIASVSRSYGVVLHARHPAGVQRTGEQLAPTAVGSRTTAAPGRRETVRGDDDRDRHSGGRTSGRTRPTPRPNR